MSTDERRIQRWLDWLRDGSEVDKIAARRGLAGVFEARGMLDEAIELLERNVEAGERGADTLRRLSRLYQARDAATVVVAEGPTSRHPWAPARPSLPEAMEVRAGASQVVVAPGLVPFLAVVVGLGITLGTGLWMLTPLLKP